MAVEINALKTKRNVHIKTIKRIEKQVNDDTVLNGWTKNDLSERVNKLNRIDEELSQVTMQIVCEDNETATENASEDEEVEELLMSLKAKLNEQLDKISDTTVNQANRVTHDKICVQVQQTDATGNIPNTWGTFSGDYSKWKAFRDGWIASMHDNKNVKTLTKLRNLLAACKGEASGVVGEWDLLEENYEKAWDRLRSIYEDDYMQVQSFMRKLNQLPPMRNASSKAIRDTIDIVQKHVHGVSKHIKIDEKHPYIVFNVIERMDTETYRAWEKYRPSLAKANANDTDANDNPNKIGKHIPTWAELEEFLEGEVTIRVHSEKRNEVNNPQPKAINAKQIKRFNKQNNAKKRSYPDFLQCVLCENIHPIFRCECFIAMNLSGRKNHVAEHQLCVRCLRNSHTGPCARKECNEPCPKCKPDNKYHNSLLCPNESSTVLVAHTRQNKLGKRKLHDQQNRSHKRARVDDKRFKQSDANQMQSGVHKVGEWALVANQSNAIKRIKDAKDNKGECQYTTLLATINMRMQINIDWDTICRSIADTGATLNGVSKQFVEENAMRTIKCQKCILGVSGPEIIKRKIVTVIRPWFESEVQIATEFYVFDNLSGVYPNNHIEAYKHEIMHLGLADENFDIPSPINALLGAEIYANIIGPDLYKHKDGAIMQSTSFGHIILGKFFVKKDQQISDMPISNVMQCVENENNAIANALKKFWEIEDVNKCKNKAILSEEHKAVENLFIKTHYRDANGRYVVSIPLRPNHKNLGNSRSIALRQFSQLERRLEKNPELK
ncbi:uncharacterized protein LOC116350124, partial [Contarinia nasturtii]|uniref:uncharacterized protein LOC116350124 n=1 Tax=Contarinia nasturtii TaxID=265458 RepID=UPI0012D440CF